MDVREKLVELLSHATFGVNKQTILSYLPPSAIEEVVDNLIANCVTVQEWVSTDERMPTEDDATDGYVAVVYDGEKTISLVDVVIAHPDLYDYWMPLNLPQPPKGE